MSKLPAFCIAALVLAPCQVQAKQLDANLYAAKYCALRAQGVPSLRAAALAVEGNNVAEGLPTPVWIQGKKFNSDVVTAVRVARAKCPDI